MMRNSHVRWVAPGLETRQLALVQAIAETGSMARASAVLHATPSALSHQLSLVEGRLGVRLFDRIGRRLVLNQAGQVVLDTAARVLPALAGAEDALRRMRDAGPPMIRLSTECYTCYDWLPRALLSLRRELPGLEVRIRPEFTQRPLEALLAGQLDVAVVSGRVPARKDLAVCDLFRDELVVLAPATSPLAARAFVRPVDFAAETVLVYSADPRISSLLGEVLEPAGVRPARTCVVPLTEAIVELVRAGEGVALLARWAVARHIDGVTLKALRLGRRGHFRRWRAVAAAGGPGAQVLPRLAVALRAMGDPPPRQPGVSHH